MKLESVGFNAMLSQGVWILFFLKPRVVLRFMGADMTCSREGDKINSIGGLIMICLQQNPR